MSTAIVLPGFERLAAEFGPDAPVDLPHLMAEFERDNQDRVCEGCGCTQTQSCIDETGAPCAWVEDYDGDLCTACAAVAAIVADESFRRSVMALVNSPGCADFRRVIPAACAAVAAIVADESFRRSVMALVTGHPDEPYVLLYDATGEPL